MDEFYPYLEPIKSNSQNKKIFYILVKDLLWNYIKDFSGDLFFAS